MNDDRFVLLLDILGFKQLVATSPLRSICTKVQSLLSECESWAAGRSETDFDTIHFSDTVLIYTRGAGAYKEWYDDMVFIGSRICCKMFAEGLPMRGALSYGSFLVQEAGRHRMYLGKALIKAYETAEPKESHDRDFMGFKVTSATWRMMYPAASAKEGIRELGWGVVQDDDALLVNFFQELRGNDHRQIAFDFEQDLLYPERTDNYWALHELNAFRHIRDMEKSYAKEAPASSIARKYTNTMNFIRDVLGERLYDTVDALADEIRIMPSS